MPLEVKEIRTKTILTPSHLENNYDFSLNPYVGCGYGCTYCYASFTGKYVGKQVKDWGTYVFAKINAPLLLSVELKNLKDHGAGQSIWLSSITDPYQGIESKYQLTHQCLQVLIREDFQGSVLLLTKSDLILRDLELLKAFKNLEVGISINTTDEKILRIFDKFAPSAKSRLNTLERLNAEGIHTYAFMGPLLPHFMDHKSSLEKTINAIKATGTNEVDIHVEHLLFEPHIRCRLEQEVKKEIGTSMFDKICNSQTNEYRNSLDSIIQELLGKHGLKMRLAQMRRQRRLFLEFIEAVPRQQ